MALFCFLVSFLLVGWFDLGQTFDFDNVCSLSGTKRLEVMFGSNNVDCGTIYDLTDVSSVPNIKFPNSDKDKLYTVVMIDPDAPSRQSKICRSWIHFIMTNIKGADLAGGISPENNSNLVFPYNRPTPPQGTGYHRYIVAAFSQASELKNFTPPSQRCHFDIDQFATGNNSSMTLNAVNMFKTQHKT